jgi:DNA-binding CsgD family transcriptional regulator
MDRLVKSTTNALRRAELQSAQVDILLGAGRAGDAREACDELTVTAKRFRAGLLGAVADYADGAVGVAEGDAFAALESLRSAFQAWQEADAPYLVARTRVLIGVACRVLGDDEGASLELEAARSVFERLGAAPDLALIKSLLTPAGEDQPGGLTTRQLMVLRLIATGKTNKEIAGELFVSERTIDRHVSNILAKLALPSRAAATAYAYENGLI